MARWARNVLVVLGPALLVSWPALRSYLALGTVEPSDDVVLGSVLAHVTAALLVFATLAMAGRLVWEAGEVRVLAARALLWLDLAGVWAIVCAAATTAIAFRLPAADAVWGVSIAVAVAGLLSAALLARVIRGAERAGVPPRPWTLFA